MTLETHIHADHVSGASRLRSLTGCKVAYPAMEGLTCADIGRSEEHTSELQSLMRISYAVFCLKKKTTTSTHYSLFVTTCPEYHTQLLSYDIYHAPIYLLHSEIDIYIKCYIYSSRLTCDGCLCLCVSKRTVDI